MSTGSPGIRRMSAKMITDAMKSTATVCPERDRTKRSIVPPRRGASPPSDARRTLLACLSLPPPAARLRRHAGARSDKASPRWLAKYHKHGEATGHGLEQPLCGVGDRWGAIDPGAGHLVPAAGRGVSGAGG